MQYHLSFRFLSTIRLISNHPFISRLNQQPPMKYMTLLVVSFGILLCSAHRL
jgi:hypothetical protein